MDRGIPEPLSNPGWFTRLCQHQTHWRCTRSRGSQTREWLSDRWTYVDPDNGTLRVRRELRCVGVQGLVYEKPKAELSRRTPALPRQLVEALRTHRAAQFEERIAAGSLWEDNDLVFAQATAGLSSGSRLALLEGPPARGRPA